MWLLRYFRFPPPDVFLVGGASCERNEFWSQRVPGIHSCKTKNLTEIFRNYDERKQLISIDNNTRMNAHCTQKYDIDEISELNELAKEKSYLNIYFNKIKGKARLFENESFMYTTFTISFDSNNKTAFVKSSNPVNFSKNESFSFFFIYNESNIVYAKTSPEKRISMSYTLSLLSISTLVFMICRIMLKSQYMAVSTVDVSERWRQPKFMSIELYMATYGVAMLFVLPIYWLLSSSSKTHFIKVITAGLIGFIVPSVCRTIFGKIVNEEIKMGAYSVPPLIYNIFFILPLTAANWFGTVICGSLRGIAGTMNVFLNMMLSSLIVLVCCSSGKIGSILWDNSNDNDGITFEQSNNHHPKCFTEIITAIIYVSGGTLFSFPLINEAQKFFLLSERIETANIVQTVLTFACFSFVLSCLRTLHLHRTNEFSWMSGFVLRNFILACVVGLREVWRLFATLLKSYHFEASVYYATGVMMVIGVMIGVGAGSAMIAAFLLTKSVFP